MKNLIINDSFKKFAPGVQFFVPDDIAAYTAKKPCNGFGMIRYGEGSVYCGDIYFDGTDHNKIGFGRQDFLPSPMLGGYNERTGTRAAFYIGMFDYRKTDWIYGNGIMYFVDKDNAPKYFIKGFFEGTRKIGEYDGDFDYSALAPGYTPGMEWDYDPWIDRLEINLQAYKNVSELDNLFIGDSYFDIWAQNGFYSVFGNAHNLNIGVGGTKFSDWNETFIDKFKEISCPKRIIINLGFNDIHNGRTAERVFSEYKTAVSLLRKYFPYAEYILLNVVKAPSMGKYAKEEEKFNALTAEASTGMKVKTVDMRAAVEASDNNGDHFDTDQIHLNGKGYSVFSKLLVEVLSGLLK